MKKVGEILDLAIERQASDIHIVGDKVYFRMGRKVVPILDVPFNIQEASLISPTDLGSAVLRDRGAYDFAFDHKEYRIRANLHTSGAKLAISMRLINKNPPALENLNLDKRLFQVVDFEFGLVLITGRTGAGKTTTVSSLISMINDKHSKHIITIENPIEYVIESNLSLVEQREIGRDVPSFYEGTIQAMRQDPDVLVVGELRDSETAQVVLQAANTGHLVFTTLHAGNLLEAIERFVLFFPPSSSEGVYSSMSSCLDAVINQTLRADLNGIFPEVQMLLPYGNTAIKNIIRTGRIEQLQSYEMKEKKE